MNNGRPSDYQYAYQGREEGLPPPRLRKVPTGPVKSTPAMIDAALERAYAESMARNRGAKRHCAKCFVLGHNVRNCPTLEQRPVDSPDEPKN